MRKVIVLAAAAASVLASPAFAQSRVVDQFAVDAGQTGTTSGGQPAPTSVSESINYFTNLGQSFTPTFSSIDFATFQFRNDNGTYTKVPGMSGYVGGPVVPAAYNVSLYSGFGSYNSSTLLGTSLTSVIAPGYTGNTEFDFLSSIALNSGQMYTFIFNSLSHQADPNFDDGVSAQIAGSGTSTGDAYTRGRATFYPSADFVFSEGVFGTATGAVPEPTSWAMMIFGVGAVGYALRRRQKVAARGSYAA